MQFAPWISKKVQKFVIFNIKKTRFSLFFALYRLSLIKLKMAVNQTLIISISEKKVININQNRKRQFRPETWKDNVAKRRRNRGEPYVSRNNIPRAGKNAPTMVKVCSARCPHNGCVLLTLPEKLQLFQEYYNMGTYELQRTYLLGLMDNLGHNGNGNIFEYHIKIGGIRRTVCKRTWQDTFQISEAVVKSMQEKCERGHNSVFDGRGRHTNHTVNPAALNVAIMAHINTYPRYEHHYCTAKLGQFYLSPDLTLDAMFADFVIKHPMIADAHRKEQVYRRCFRDSNLTIGHTYTDTCRKCDILDVELKIARRNNNVRQIDVAVDARRVHLDFAAIARNQLIQDELRSQNDPEFVMICGDMQKVLTREHSYID
ncbi:uncharacterized protein LOC110844895 [Folsomia candida]|nr:uncharacterized protein LOC110844586 [Folsomia candida]XP_021946914.2 uncharacterized protein LOC110844895 [Folsomia candida]